MDNQTAQQHDEALLKFRQLLDQPLLEIGYNPRALHDYIKGNWPESHIIELLHLLLDLSPDDMVK